LAEDAAQEVLLRAMEKMPGFRAESEFSTWVYRIALNYCLEIRRTAQRREALAPPDEVAHTRDFSSRVDTRLALENALDALPEAQRIALILRQWHDKSYAEIGDILGLPAATVKSRLYEARQQFQRIWEAQNAE
jgi:RNA polymerase sigma-70 factor (ECF subfamily)